VLYHIWFVAWRIIWWCSGHHQYHSHHGMMQIWWSMVIVQLLFLISYTYWFYVSISSTITLQIPTCLFLGTSCIIAGGKQTLLYCLTHGFTIWLTYIYRHETLSPRQSSILAYLLNIFIDIFITYYKYIARWMLLTWNLISAVNIITTNCLGIVPNSL